MDTTRIEIINNSVDSLLKILDSHGSTGSNSWIIIISAIVGATAAIGSQFVMHFLSVRRERKNRKQELLAKSRSLSLLLAEYYKELVMHKVHKQYWYRASGLSPKDTLAYKNHLESNNKSFETESKIRSFLSDYVMTITEFQIMVGFNSTIEHYIKLICELKPRKASTFSNIIESSKLFEAANKEEENLNIEYETYSIYFNKILNTMLRILKIKKPNVKI